MPETAISKIELLVDRMARSASSRKALPSSFVFRSADKPAEVPVDENLSLPGSIESSRGRQICRLHELLIRSRETREHSRQLVNKLQDSFRLVLRTAYGRRIARKGQRPDSAQRNSPVCRAS